MYRIVSYRIPVQFPGRATIPLDSNLGQVVYSHCLHSFSAPRNWGRKGEFSAPKWSSSSSSSSSSLWFKVHLQIREQKT